jgi:2-isopropylmalate synthase
MGSGSNARAVAFVEITTPSRVTLFGCGVHANIVSASLLAVLSAVNRALGQGAIDDTMPMAGTGVR